MIILEFVIVEGAMSVPFIHYDHLFRMLQEKEPALSVSKAMNHAMDYIDYQHLQDALRPYPAYMSMGPAQGFPDRMQVFLKSVVGTTSTLTVPSSCTLKEFKRHVQDRGLPIRRCRFTYCCVELSDDDKTLREYQIENGATIHQFAILRGC
jgi:hypothetical protein